jgi:hypothetical protein
LALVDEQKKACFVADVNLVFGLTKVVSVIFLSGRGWVSSAIYA